MQRTTWMAREVAATPEIVARQHARLAQTLADLSRWLRARPPQLVVTCARGSSAHAATFAKHIIEKHLRLPVCAASPSIASVYAKELQLRGQLALIISQSGASDDLVSFAKAARAAGSLTVALTNAAEAPLNAQCDIVLDMAAGVERSVAATKTFIASVTAVLRLVACWSSNSALDGAVRQLPGRLRDATRLDWRECVPELARTKHLVTIGRGPTLAVAREIALKFQETCRVHAEAFSGAEYRHGPIALASARLPVLMFIPSDEAAIGMQHLAAQLQSLAMPVFVAEHGAIGPGRLPMIAAAHPDTDAICVAQAGYGLALALAERVGADVDKPTNLTKVTNTT